MFVLSVIDRDDQRDLLVASLHLRGRYLYADACGARYRFRIQDVINLSPVNDHMIFPSIPAARSAGLN
jgi:hypothetical protein